MNRLTLRRRVLAGIAVVAGLVTPLTAAAPHAWAADRTTGTATCRSVALPVPEDARSWVTGGEPTGRYLVGYAAYPVDTADHVAGLVWVGC